ncbi:tetratricopeptide repeat protein [Luteolibacter soli]|uniref:Tetratricopeptide repeat protein n=1 Tax=Luteolibacter soli TaxID=3135280 RepID=A0ABU9ATN6_9BACT
MINRKVILILAACVFPLSAGEIPEKAERYRTMLLKKPENPVLFGRMLDAWLEEKELEALKPELEERAKAGAAADWRLLAVYHEHSGDEAAALKALDEAVKLAPQDAATRLARGKALGVALRFDAALEDLAVAAKDKELGVEAGTLRGKILARAGRPAEAVKAWKELIAANPADEGLKEDLVELEIGEGMLEEAVTAARELAEKTDDPYKKALRHLQVAEILAQAGKKEDSLKEYRDVFAVSAEGSWLEREVLARAGALFSREDDSAGLKEFLGGLREAYPRRVAVKKEAAKAMLAGGEEDEAIAMFREVLKVMPGDREVREEFIGLLEGAERPKEASEELAALLETAKGDVALWERMAALKKALKDDAGLKDALDKAIALTPDDEAGQVARARLLERFEKFGDAEKILREAIAKHGKGGEAGEALATFLVAREKGDDAVALWKEMAAAADREGLLRIARSLAANGKSSEAFAMLQPRVKDFPNDPLLLAALCQAAQLSDKPESAIPQAMELVRQAKSPTDLDTALRLASSLIARAEEPKKWLDELASKQDLTLPERCLLSEIHETLGDSIAAEKVLKDAMAGDDSLLAATQRVRLHEIRGDMDKAIAAMREMMALPGGMKTAHVKKLVELLERDGDSAKALEATNEWLKLAPGDKAAWTKRAELLLGDGRPAEAVAELRRALAKFGGEEELREKLADAQREAGMMEEAWRSFTALYDEAESPASKLKWAAGLARMAETEGKEEELISDFRRRARDNPSSPLPLLALADMYREWQLPDEEQKCVAEASRRKPDDSQLKFRMADLQETSGNADASADILRGMLGGADAPEARRRLSSFWIRQGETERALRELAESGKSSDARAVEKLVMPLARAKEWEAAATVLARETVAYPDDWRLAYLYAVVLLEGGKKDEALGRFAALLEADGDLKTPVPAVPQNRYNYPGMNPTAKKPVVSHKAMPEFYQYQSQVMSFKDPDRYGYYGGTQPGDVPLPVSADALRRMALAQLFQAAKDDKEKRPAILAKVASSHFEDLDSFKRVFFLDAEELKALVLSDKAKPDDFRWYFQLSSSQPNRSKPDKDFNAVIQRGIDLVSKDDPELAFWMANRLPLDGDDGVGEKGARQRIELFKRLDEEKQKNNFYQIQSVAFGGDKVPAEVKAEAEKLFLAGLEKMDGGLTGNYYAMELAGRWIRDGQLERGIEWLNRMNAEMKRDPVKAQQAANRYRMNYYGYMGGSGNRQAYPQVLAEISPQVYGLLGNRNNNGGQMTEKNRQLLKLLGDTETNYPGQTPQKPVDIEGLAALASKVEDRVQRICIYEPAGKTKEVEREIAAIEAAPDAKLEELLLASYFYAKKSPEKSYALLLKARDLGDNSPWRERVEQELVTTGVALAKAQAKDVDLEPARRAALRMRKSVSFNQEMKGQLAGWMKELGMEDESKRFVSGPANGFVNRAMRNRYGISRSSPSRQKTAEDAGRLAKDGKREAAARLLLASLRQMATNPNASYETERLMSNVKSLKLEKEMVRLSAPVGEASYNRRRDHALLLISLEQKADAEPLLRKLAEEKPDDVMVKTALYSVLKPEEQLKQAKELAKGNFDEEMISSLFATWMRGNTAAKKFDGLEAMTGLLENLEPSFKNDRNLSWVNYLMAQLVSDDSMDVQLTSLFKKQEGNGEQYNKEQSQRREELCKRMFRAMVRHPQTAEQGFVLLSGTREVLGATPEELDAAALSAMRLVIRIEPPPVSRRYYSNRRGYLWSWVRGNSSSGGNRPQGLMPSAWLAQRATQGKVMEPYDKEFILGLAKEGGDWAKTIETCEAIVAAPGLAKFEEWKKTAAERSQQSTVELEWISRTAAAAKRDDLKGAIEDFMCEGLRQGTYDSQSFAQELAQSVEDARDPAARMAALRRLTTKILGPEEAWPLYAELRNGGYYMQGPNQRMNAFQNIWSSFNGNEVTAVCAMRFAAGYGLTGGGSLNWYQILENSNGNVPAASRMLNAGYFAPGPEVVADPKDGNGKSMLDYGLNRLKQRDGAPKLGEELMKVEGADRFWARIFGAILANKPEVAYAELDRESATIAKWSAEARQDLWGFIATWLPEAPTKASASVRKQLTENLKQGDGEAKKKAEQYLKDGIPQDGRSSYSSDSEIQQLVSRLVSGNAELAAKLWDKALEQMRGSSQGWSSSSGGFTNTQDTYAHAQLMDLLLNRKIPLKDLCEFLAAFSKQPSASKLGEYESNFSYYLDRIFQDEIKRRDAEIKKLKLADGLPTSAGLYTLLIKDTPAELRGIMGALVINRIRNQSPWNYPNGWQEKLSAWTADLKKTDPVFANAVKLAVLAGAGDRPNDAAKADFKASFAAFVAEAKIPIELKFDTVVGLLYERPSSQLDDPACAKAMADFLCSYLTPDRTWAGYQSVPALNNFASWKSISKEDAKRLLDAFQKSRVDFANGSGEEDKAHGLITALNLSLALGAGDAEGIARAARTGSGVRGRLDLAVRLWQGGLGDSAKMLIARPGEYHQAMRAVVLGEKIEGQQLPPFSKESEAALPGWLKVIEDPAQGFRVECLISALPDAKDAAAPSVKRSDRLVSLAKRFAAEAPKPRVSRLESLAALAVEPACASILDSEIEAVTRGTDLGALVMTTTHSNYNGGPIDREEQAVMEILLRRSIQAQLEQSGDASRLIKQVESIQVISGGNNEYYAGQQMDRFFDPQATLLIRRIYELEGDKKKAAAAQALKLCEVLLGFDQRDMQRDAIALGIMSQLAGGDGSAFDRWLDGLPPDTRKRYDQVRKQHSLAQAFPTIHEPPLTDAAYEKPRRDLLAAMLTDPATLKREITHPTVLSGLLDSKAFTREDIFAVVDALPADHPMKAKFLTEKAGIIGWRSDEKENAIKGFDAADAAAKASGDAKSAAYARAYRAKYLEDRQQKTAEAAAIAKEIKPDDLDEKERKWMEDLIKKAETKK